MLVRTFPSVKMKSGKRERKSTEEKFPRARATSTSPHDATRASYTSLYATLRGASPALAARGLLRVESSFPCRHNFCLPGQLLHTVRFVSRERPFSRLKPKSGVLTHSKKSLSTHFFRPSFPNEFYTRFLLLIASLIPPQNTPTRPHTHTRHHTAVSYNSADAGLAWLLPLLLFLAASQRGAFLAPLANSAVSI